MNVERLIQILQKPSPNAEVDCVIGDSSLVLSDLFDLEELPKYEIEYVLRNPKDDKCCTLLLKKLKR